MKSKLINFIAAMGIPVSGITTQGAGCTGICGSCSWNCCFTAFGRQGNLQTLS